MTKLYFLSLFTLVVIYAAAQGRAGTPDSSFGVNSIKVIVTPDSLGSRQVKKLVVLPNDKIVTLLGYPLGGGTGGTLVRNRLNGSVDSSFGVNGVLPVSNMTPFNLAVQKDGNILTAGTGDQTGWVIVNRFLPDGKPDTLFGKAGATAMYIDDTGDALPAAVALQENGNIVVAGTVVRGDGGYYGYAARFKSNGRPDKSFGTDGKTFFPANTSFFDMVIQNNDGIVCGGNIYSKNSDQFYVARLLPNGHPDNQFGSHGQVITDLGYGDHYLHELAVQPDDKIIAAGVAGTDRFNGVEPKLAVVRYNTNGSLDSSFSGDGQNLLRIGGYRTQGNAVVLQKDGKIVAGGWIADANDSRFLLARYNRNGLLDSSFGTGGISFTDIGNVNDQIMDLGLQRSGKIIAGGLSGSNVLVRYFGGSAANKTASVRDETAAGSNLFSQNMSDKKETGIKLSPNPVRDVLHVKVSGTVSVTVINGNGKTVLVKTINGNGDIDVSHLPGGVYYVTDNSTHTSSKIVVEK